MRIRLLTSSLLALTTALGTAAGAASAATTSAHHDAKPAVTSRLNHASYSSGDKATLVVKENVTGGRGIKVKDSSGTSWTLVSDNGRTARYSAVVGTTGGTVHVKLTRQRDGMRATTTASYLVRAGIWPGGIPGSVVLGMSCGTVCSEKAADLGQAFGVHRQYTDWGDWSRVAKDIKADHAAGRLPWVSVKSPGGASGWKGVAGGAYDDDIAGLADALKANDGQPILLTFHHEPSNDGTEAQGADWAAAYVHFHDTLSAAGALANVSDVPIVGDWLFNPTNRTQDPANWITPAVLERAPFLGVDMYENASGETFATRIPRITHWMASQGFPNLQVGIGETGSTDYYDASDAVTWMNDSLGWAMAHPDQVGVVSYFNSTANSRDGVYWPLDESTAKLAAFRGWLNSPVSTP